MDFCSDLQINFEMRKKLLLEHLLNNGEKTPYNMREHLDRINCSSHIFPKIFSESFLVTQKRRTFSESTLLWKNNPRSTQFPSVSIIQCKTCLDDKTLFIVDFVQEELAGDRSSIVFDSLKELWNLCRKIIVQNLQEV